jgi:hypothetical protein
LKNERNATEKRTSGARWEVMVDRTPRTYRHDMQLAIEAAEYLKLMAGARPKDFRI